MAIPLESIPSFSPDEALELILRVYGLGGDITTLPSERDQNFRLDGAEGRFVVKFANLHDSVPLLELQNMAMRHVAQHAGDCRVPCVVPSLRGRDIESAIGSHSGATHYMRILGWVEGEVLAATSIRDDTLFDSIGLTMARLDAALDGFEHPALYRTLQWDVRRADMARENVALLGGPRRGRVQGLFECWQTIEWAKLRFGAIHGDANDHNLLIEDGRMVGLLDFGDMVHSAVVCDLAIALTYVMLGEVEPVHAAARVSRAYQRRYPLNAAEQHSLYPLILSRLGMSVCYSAHNRARNPTDPYQVVSENAAWELLDRLEAQRFETVQAALGAGSAQ